MSNELLVKLENITKEFGKGDALVRALKNINYEFKKGEVFLLMGPSGSGKTTLLSVMGLLLRPTSGKIYLADRIFDENSKQEALTRIRRDNIGFIFQSFNLVPSLNVTQNVEIMAKIGMLPKAERTGYKKKCKEMLKMLNMGHRLKSDINNLSGGERQRVAIARALINDPAVILADEPTGNLDAENGRIIGEYFQRIAKERQKTIVIATHDDRLRFCANKTMHMEDGNLKG